MPLFNPAPCRFEFISPDESELANPWKESFRQLYRGVHVRPGYQDMKFKGRNLCYFNTVQGALDYADERSGSSNTSTSNAGSGSGSASGTAGTGGASGTTSNTSSTSNNCAGNNANENSSGNGQGALVFLHAGTYRGEFLVIDSDIALIGMYIFVAAFNCFFIFVFCLFFFLSYVIRCCAR